MQIGGCCGRVRQRLVTEYFTGECSSQTEIRRHRRSVYNKGVSDVRTGAGSQFSRRFSVSSKMWKKCADNEEKLVEKYSEACKVRTHDICKFHCKCSFIFKWLYVAQYRTSCYVTQILTAYMAKVIWTIQDDYRLTKHGSIIAYEPCIRRDIPWQLRSSGQR